MVLPLRESEKVDLAMLVQGGEGAIPKEFMTEVVLTHITGWENFNDDKGKEVVFSPENLDRVPWEILLEVGTHIIDASGFLNVQRKN